MSSPSVVVVSGNPRAGSRTLAAARAVAERLAALVPGDPGGPAAVEVVDLAALAGELLAPAHPAADAALARLASADLAVIATPVYKASYTGLLKAFLDLYRADGLAGVVAVPLVVSGSPAHALAGEVHLRPVLVELGAVVPARSLTLTEAQLGDLGPALDAWLVRAAAPLRRALGAAADVAPAADLAGAVR
ncbi:NADPH-dependent oxidoreductase [Cellulomonas hominis]|uniref:NADPH-dependent oxidoreductase n=1 Tax=Cellulomonas hominis TaxID=156981 RepID=A0A7Z8NP09_9CELL|nr:NAD(P)H-dependent oxidoreductase [Cellulomonas hominis]TKR21932.1 NADPH-dependent oxidoreductase [Cellulomonas hominis]